MPFHPALVRVVASSADAARGRACMLFDNIVLTGAMIIVLALLFVAGLAIYIWKDSRRGD